MKKQLLLLVGAIVAFAAHAQLYLCGADFGWNSDSPKEVTLSDGWYNFQVSGDFKMSRTTGSWDDFNGNSLDFDGNAWTDNGSIKENTLVASTKDTGDKAAPSGYSYLRVSSDFTKIQASKDGNFSGGSVVTQTYKLKGTFTGTGWTLVDLPYEHTFDGSQGEQQYGLDDGKGGFKSGGTTFSGQKLTWTISGNLGNDKIAANYKGKVRFSVEGDVFTIEPVGATETVYELWSNFRNGETFLAYALNEANNYSYTLNFEGDETGTKAGLHVNGNWKGAGNASAYDGNTKTYNMTTTEGGDITFAAGLMGAVKFVLNVADNTLTVSGGQINQGGDEPGTYTVYFYDRNNVGTDLYVHIWKGEGNNAVTFKPWGKHDEIKMKSTGKYILRDGKYFPLYVLNFSWNQTPEKILIWNGNSDNEKKFVEDVKFVNNGYYTNGSTVVEQNLSPVEMGDVYLYFHFKEDLIFEATNGKNAATYCNVMKGENYIGGLVRNDAHKMELVSEKYQIHRYKLTPEELAEGNNVEFSFQNKDGSWATFRASYAEKFNQARWTEFIYSSAKRDVPNVGNNKQYAVQTYLSWSDFAELDAKGRPCAYLVGEGAIDGLTWSPADAVEFVNKDGACFYIPVNITGQKTTFFKVSWVNVKHYKENATEGMTCDARDWATFDLGIVGIDDQFKYPADSYTPSIKLSSEMGQSVNCAIFGVNTSVKYCNYNQYNFTIEGKKLPAGTYYVVIDTHDTCRTVTLVDFNPNPSVEVEHSDVIPVGLTPDQAKALHRHYNHLGCASYNGHIPMDKVNICSGSLTIHGSSGLDISDSGFDIEYTVEMNGDKVMSHKGKPAKITMDFLPLASSEAIAVRACYTDKERSEKTYNGEVYRAGRKGTGLTFHSRIGQNTIEIPANLAAPVAEINNAKYAIDYDGVYGVLIDDIKMEVTTDYNVYGDLTFEFDDPTYDTSRRVHIIDDNYPLKSAYSTSSLAGWTPLQLSEDSDFSNYDFDGGSNDWSSKIIKSGVNVPVYLSKYTTVSDKALLENKTVKGVAHAIYPFLYELTPTLHIEEETEPSAAPRRAATATLPDNLDGFAISHFSQSTPISKEVNANNAVSGIENVAVDADAAADAEFYNMQGVRVFDPAPGVYLMRKGDKVTKVVVR